MPNDKNLKYEIAIAQRIGRVMEIAKLEISGFALLIGLSEGHLYSLLNGRRRLTMGVAKRIGNQLNFDGQVLFNLNHDIPFSIVKSASLNNFCLKYKDNIEYFKDTRVKRKVSQYLETMIIGSEFLAIPKYTWEINELCKSLGLTITSDRLKKHLKHFVAIGKLRSEKRMLKLRNGEFGKRLVEIFYN